MVPLASDQSKVYLEGTLGRRWSPIGQQPLGADGARQKQAENLYGAVHLGTGAEVAPFAIDGQDSEATIRWYELLLAECPQGQILLWQDQAPPHTSEEVEGLVSHPAAHRYHRLSPIDPRGESQRGHVEGSAGGRESPAVA